MRLLVVAAAVAALLVPAAPAQAAAPGPKVVKVQKGALSPKKVRWLTAKPHMRGVRVVWWSGVEPCTVLTKVVVKETKKTVRITLYDGSVKDAGMCVAMAIKKATYVRLKNPVGKRVILDGSR
ncbi:hypothetical protein [Herbidospora mongoliensis]|uniref:hypothetical protein n=1 Tax=Herbidospora mongoliensis TaxID=688067 RepID=UPI0009FDEB69|nr:hypothetical protein [Herbidospora mongoliensis]